MTKIRKYPRSKAFDDNRKLAYYAKLSSRNAIDDLLEAGISVVYLKDGKLVRKGPDNKLTVLKESENKEKFDLREYLCHGYGLLPALTVPAKPHC
ncbi:MAG: hypothetical protein LPK03_02150 [Pontibacter sp.]|nr:hypothetical protein [Pontibacter sp.]